MTQVHESTQNMIPTELLKSDSLISNSINDYITKLNTLEYLQKNNPNYPIPLPLGNQIDLSDGNYPGGDFIRHRRSKYDKESLKYACDCGKIFVSLPGLHYHLKTKHPHIYLSLMRRGRGRPRKYPQNEITFENTKYDNFFQNPKRRSDWAAFNVKDVVDKVFEFIYKGKYKDKLFSKPEKYEDNYILDNLVKNEKLPLKPKNEICCDEAFYEYLYTFKNKTNDKYFTLLLKFILLFRECYDVHNNRNVPDDKKKQTTNKINPEQLPELCNKFYGDFLELNDFFGINDEDVVDFITANKT